MQQYVFSKGFLTLTKKSSKLKSFQQILFKKLNKKKCSRVFFMKFQTNSQVGQVVKQFFYEKV